MTAKTNAERQREFKARMKEQGLTRLFLYAKPEHHQAIRQFANQLHTLDKPIRITAADKACVMQAEQKEAPHT